MTSVDTELPGNIWKVLVKVGDLVKQGDTLFILEVMKTEVAHLSPRAGRVAFVHIVEGAFVDGGQRAIDIEVAT